MSDPEYQKLLALIEDWGVGTRWEELDRRLTAPAEEGGGARMASAFIDANIFIAFGNAHDRDHERSTELLERVRKGEFGTPYTSDYVLDEAVTIAVVRTRRLTPAVKVGKIILGSKSEGLPALARLLRVDEHIFAEAWRSFQADRVTGLSFTDHTILAQLKEFRIDVLLSFDTGFDGLAARIP